jgi:hypothetical protein
MPSSSLPGFRQRYRLDGARLDTIRAFVTMEGLYVKGDFIQRDVKGATNMTNVDIDIEKKCRTKMIGWCYLVDKFCNFNQNVVEVEISYLNRFLITHAGTIGLTVRNAFQPTIKIVATTTIKHKN